MHREVGGNQHYYYTTHKGVKKYRANVTMLSLVADNEHRARGHCEKTSVSSVYCAVKL